MHGAGNDFVLLDGLSALISPQLDMSQLAQLLCARHFGVGADGLLSLEPSETADARMKMLVLHAPEALGLKQEYIQEHQGVGH